MSRAKRERTKPDHAVRCSLWWAMIADRDWILYRPRDGVYSHLAQALFIPVAEVDKPVYLAEPVEAPTGDRP